MSTKGKRVIWAGPIDGSNCKPLNVEGIALEAVAPGTLVTEGESGIETDGTPSTEFGSRFLVADKDQQRTRSVDDAWAVGDNMVAIAPRSGEFVNVLVAVGNDGDTNTPLTRNAATGHLKVALTDNTEEIVAFSAEPFDVTGAAALVRVLPA